MDNTEISGNKGKLYIVSTPIGNKDDISLRAINTIKRCDIVVCEEMKMGALTLKNLNLAKELIPLNENNESEMTMEVLNLLRSGKKIALISDAGTPIFADPGQYLLRNAISNDIEVEVVPGASCIMTAIVRSGFDLYEFLYAGFLPRKNEDRDRKLQKIARERRTVVILDTPYRLQALIAACAEVMPERKAYLGMNLTMPFETHHYGTFDELNKKFENSKIKSEFVIVMDGNKEWIGKRVQDVEIDNDDEDDDDEPVEYEYPVKAHVKQIQERNSRPGFGSRTPDRKFGGGGFVKRGSGFSGGGERSGGFSKSRSEGGYQKRDNSGERSGGYQKRDSGGERSGGFSKSRGEGGFPKRDSKFSGGGERSGGFSKSRGEGGFPKRDSNYSGGGERSGGFSKSRGEGGFPKRDSNFSGGGERSGGFSKSRGEGGFPKRDSNFSGGGERSGGFSKSRDFSDEKKFSPKRDDKDGGFSAVKKTGKSVRGRFTKGRS
jgi:16S rRNA (cytidine1402-2'-O)-methyltransferase